MPKHTLHIWKSDFIASINVMLVALPLGLGLASAAGIEPISGVISAIVGGIVCTFIRGSYVAINGPGYSIIAVIVLALETLKKYPNNSFEVLLAAFIVSGVFTIILGIIKFGELGRNIPRSVITGLLASVGVIIILKQLPPALGTELKFSLTSTYFQSIHLPEVFIFLISTLIIIFYEKSKSKFIKLIPSPVWVLLFGIPFTLWFNLKTTNEIDVFGNVFTTGQHLFVALPADLFEHFPTADFSLINTLDFWLIALSIALVGSLESLLSAKAVEKLDPLKRPVNINKDIISIGVATVVSGFVGGMPVNVVISRSSVNTNSGAKTGLSNFMHAILLIGILLFLQDYVTYIPFPCLAAILVMTGYKLTKPKVYKDAYLHGKEQLLVLLVTLVVILFGGLITGLIVGMLFNLAVHVYFYDGKLKDFLHNITHPTLVDLNSEKSRVTIQANGVINFLNINALQGNFSKIKKGKKVSVDFSNTKLIDYTVLEYIKDFGREYRSYDKGKFETVGLDALYTSAYYPQGLHYLQKDKKALIKVNRKTDRQIELIDLTEKMNWKFDSPVCWEIRELDQFDYFKKHPIEYTSNVIHGQYKDLNVKWEISDMTFVSGAFIEKKELHTTEHLIKLPVTLPPFILSKEMLYERLIDKNLDIDFKNATQFSKNFLLKSPQQQAIRELFTPEILAFFEQNNVYHIECNGKQLVIFKNMRLASVDEIKELVDYSYKLCKLLLHSHTSEHLT